MSTMSQLRRKTNQFAEQRIKDATANFYIREFKKTDEYKNANKEERKEMIRNKFFTEN